MLNLTAREPRKAYLERLIFLAALVVLSAFLQGARAVVVSVLSVVLCMAADAVCCKIRKIPYDIKAFEVPFWGLASAAMMPSSVSVWAVALSAVICIVVGKHLFGASDNIVFSPPAIAAAFLIICYPAEMLYFPKYGEQYPVFGTFEGLLSRSAEYSLKMGAAPSGTIWENIMGLVPAPICSSYILVILVCGACLILMRSGSLCSTVSCLAVSGVLAFFFPRANISGWQSVLYELCSGYLVFGTVFLAAEPYRTPQKTLGKVIYGAFLGYTTMMFRFFGQTEGSFLFALLITSALLSSFDRVVENLSYWKRKYVNSFEKNKTQVQKGGPKLSDTQEIVLPEKYRYNTPPIDGEIKKRRRKGTPAENAEKSENAEKTENVEDNNEKK